MRGYFFAQRRFLLLDLAVTKDELYQLAHAIDEASGIDDELLSDDVP